MPVLERVNLGLKIDPVFNFGILCVLFEDVSEELKAFLKEVKTILDIRKSKLS